MADSPLYIFIDNNAIEVQREKAYHQTADGRHFVELTDPELTLDGDGTDEQWREFSARLAQLISTVRR